MILMLTQALLKEPPIKVEHCMPPATGFLPTTEMVGSRSDGVVESSNVSDLPPLFMSRDSFEVEAQEGIHLKGSEASSRNAETCLARSFSIYIMQIYRFDWHCTI